MVDEYLAVLEYARENVLNPRKILHAGNNEAHEYSRSSTFYDVYFAGSCLTEKGFTLFFSEYMFLHMLYLASFNFHNYHLHLIRNPNKIFRLAASI